MRSPAPNVAAVKWSIRNLVPPGAGAGENVTFHLPGETSVPLPGRTICAGDTEITEPTRWLIKPLLSQAPADSLDPPGIDLLYIDTGRTRAQPTGRIDSGHAELHGADNLQEANRQGYRIG